jgi:DNA-binding HxlR family transcriptional regulator
VETAVRALDGKWTMLIVRELLVGPRRYGELAAALPHVSPKTLVERLRYLEGQGVIARTAYPERPRRVEYRLTPIGEDLAAVVRELWRWGARLQGTAQA